MQAGWDLGRPYWFLGGILDYSFVRSWLLALWWLESRRVVHCFVGTPGFIASLLIVCAEHDISNIPGYFPKKVPTKVGHMTKRSGSMERNREKNNMETKGWEYKGLVFTMTTTGLL